VKLRHKLQELDSLRGFAAAYVFVHHAHLASRVGLGSLLYFGQEAVTLFFLLSGFVIFYASVGPTNQDRVSVRMYLVRRVRRIYPLLLVSLAVTYIGASIAAGRAADPMWSNLLQNVFMTQDVAALKRGVWADTYYGNSPLWSLSYEWWFYMLFIPLELICPIQSELKPKIVTALAVLGFCTYQLHPNQASLFAGYFVIWWVGVEAAREYREHSTVTIARQKSAFGGLFLCAVLWTLPVVGAFYGGAHPTFGADPVLQARHFIAASMIVGVGLVWRGVRMRGFRYTFGPFRVLAPISYSLYLLHVPVLAGLERMGFADPKLRAVVAALVLVPVCYLLEVRLQRIINRWTNPVSYFMKPETRAPV
jgi:peptidoglycan/LPS O-acetylase OafA/YrhL